MTVPVLNLEDVLVITNDVWASFLEHHEPLDWSAVSLEGLELLQASVDISGEWSGTVTLEMLPLSAESAARTMLQADSVEREDVSDALGELVNMIGGNIKSLLPPGASLGLPVVSAGATSGAQEVTEVCRLELNWSGMPIRVRIWSPT